MKPRIMGVLNCTPDSFYDGGRFNDLIGRGMQMVNSGADIVDVGGESTRPNAVPVSLEEELERVIPVVSALSPHVTVSIDTTKPRVAEAAYAAGATVLNDVRGLKDKEMQEVSALFPSCVIMHSRGTPQTMQTQTHYSDLSLEVFDWLLAQAQICQSKEVILDPGIGFAKTAAQSLRLIKDLEQLALHGYPVLIGASRKSFIGHTLNQASPDERLPGSLAALAASYSRGAKVFRVHDVRESKDVVDLLWAIDHA
ncbi:MAG: dihydropteroate synthase [Myxococcota bacterium]